MNTNEKLFKESFWGLAEQILGVFSLWAENREYYLRELIPSLQADSKTGTRQERALFQEIHEVATPEQWRTLPQLIDVCAKRRGENRKYGFAICARIVKYLEDYKFEEAEILAKDNIDYVSVEAYAEARENAKRTAERAMQEACERAVHEADERRRRLSATVEAERRRVEGERLLGLELEAAMRKGRESTAANRLATKNAMITKQLTEELSRSVEKADALNAVVNPEGLVDYSRLKALHLTKWLASTLEMPQIANEQVLAIGDLAHSLLLKARAGSGKTTVITAKAGLLMKHEGVPPDEIMILAFNGKAASGVSHKIKKEQHQSDFKNARTFHSLAYQLVQPKAKLLGDAVEGSAKEQSHFVQGLISQEMNPALTKTLYSFFQRELKELEDIGTFLSAEDYYIYRRNLAQETLRGEYVKSIGEKWIADFLFEHGITYAYEYVWFWNRRNYRPDFSLFVDGPSPNIVIEHWGVDPNDPDQRVPEHWTRSWDDYRLQIDEKRGYWRRYNRANPEKAVCFLETSVLDMQGGRLAFDSALKEKLLGVGVVLERVPEGGLRERVVRHRLSRFARMCLQYINKAKRQRLSPDEMASKISAATDLAERTRVFLQVSNTIYRAYQRTLQEENRMDFDDLLNSAIDVVHQTAGTGQISISITDQRYITTNELKWILVDEFQDCSRLFHDLVAAIRIYNTDARLFCVGDDWQAINGFAGSDLKFVHKFTELFERSNVRYLQNNYRSAQQIVGLGNRFMRGKGKPSMPAVKGRSADIQVVYPEDIWIEQRPDPDWAEARASDERFQTWERTAEGQRPKDKSMRVGRVLKACHAILTSEKYSRETTFAILSRVRRFGAGYATPRSWHRKLREIMYPAELEAFGDFDARVRCSTVHGYKGMEADVVIILGVVKRMFPLIHPARELYSIFGVTPANALEEEERLFYVAITRAKADMYLFTERNRESEFLSRLCI